MLGRRSKRMHVSNIVFIVIFSIFPRHLSLAFSLCKGKQVSLSSLLCMRLLSLIRFIPIICRFFGLFIPFSPQKNALLQGVFRIKIRILFPVKRVCQALRCIFACRNPLGKVRIPRSSKANRLHIFHRGFSSPPPSVPLRQVS